MSVSAHVQGFSGHLSALNGQYQKDGDNHGRPTYKKHGEVDGTTQCCIYFWDERDGDALAGWWFAPEVGGEQVWAQCQSKTQTPPGRGWKVPWTSPTPDNRVQVTLKTAAAAPAVGGFAAAAQAQQNKAQVAAAAGKRGFDNTNSQQGANKFARTGYGQQAGHVNAAAPPAAQIPTAYGAHGMKKFPQQQSQQNTAQEARLRAQREKNVMQVNTSMTAAETAVKKLSGPEAKEENFDKPRYIAAAKAALATTQRLIDQFVKTKGLEESMVTAQKGKMEQFQRDVTAAEESLKKAQAEKLKAIKTSFVADLAKLATELEKLIEKTKDAAVLFTCEMAEHIKPEEAIDAKAKTDAEAAPATETLKKAKELILTKDKELRGFPPAEVAPIRESIKPINARIVAAEKELQQVKAQAVAAVRKAEVELQKKKREEEQEKARAERERINKWNRELTGFSIQIVLLAQEVFSCTQFQNDDMSSESLQEAESKIMGLQRELQKRHDNKDTQHQSKGPLMANIRKLDGFLKSTKQMLKEHSNKGQDKLRRDMIVMSAAIREKKGEKSDGEYFAEITAKSNKMDQFKFEKFAKTLGVEIDHPSMVFKEACKFVGADCSVLDKNSFMLFVANTYHSVMKPTPITKEVGLYSQKVGDLELNAVVQVLEGPVEADGVMRVKIQRAKKDGSLEEGFATLRVSGVENLVRYSPHYTVLAETVLTDTFDLKGFKVIRRIKAEEKFRSIGIPMYNKDADMWRINGITEDDKNVWVTIQGNRGTSLLRNEPMSAIAAAARKDAEVEDFSDEKLNSLLEAMAKTSREKLEHQVEEAAKALKTAEEKMAIMEAADEEGKEPTLEEITEIITNSDAALAAHKELSSKAKDAVNRMSQNLKTVESGPYAALKEALSKVAETLTEQNNVIKEINDKRRVVQKSVLFKETARRMAREKAEQDALAKTLMKDIEPRKETLMALLTRFADLDAKPLPNMTDSIRAFQDMLKFMTAEIATIKEAGGEALSWAEEKAPPIPKGALIVVATEFKNLRSGLTQLLKKSMDWRKKIELMETTYKEKLRVDLAIKLKDHIAANKFDEDTLFKSLAHGKETLSLDEFTKFGKTLLPELDSFDELINVALGSVKELTKEHLTQLSKVSYRCLKRALVTDILDIKTCKKVKVLESEGIVEVTQKHEVCPKTGLTRVKGRTDDGTEGYVTIKGNAGSVYLKFQQTWYQVVKETVLTSSFEMKDFKVIRRLRAGDFLRELSHPQLEEKSGLYRMKAQSVLDNEIGWVTLKNANARFLINCEPPSPKAEGDCGDCCC